MRKVLVLCFLASLATCGDSTGPESVAGTYTLRSVNGEPLPWVQGVSLREDGLEETLEVTTGHTVLGSDSSCEFSSSIVSTVVDVFGNLLSRSIMIETDPCTFVFGNGALTLNYTDGNVDTGSIAGSQLTITRGGDVWVFRK